MKPNLNLCCSCRFFSMSTYIERIEDGIKKIYPIASCEGRHFEIAKILQTLNIGFIEIYKNQNDYVVDVNNLLKGFKIPSECPYILEQTLSIEEEKENLTKFVAKIKEDYKDIFHFLKEE